MLEIGGPFFRKQVDLYFFGYINQDESHISKLRAEKLMTPESMQRLQEEAERSELLIDPSSTERAFRLDMNLGQLIIRRDAPSVLRFVELARQLSQSEERGMHAVILGLVGYVPNLDDRRVTWFRPHHLKIGVRNKEAPLGPDWLTLRGWLAREGHPFIPPSPLL